MVTQAQRYAIIMIFLKTKIFSASKEEGLFRVPGNQGDVDELKKSYDSSMLIGYSAQHGPESFSAAGKANLEHINDPHTIAGLLKLWFRELPEPVLIFRYYSTFIKVMSTV